MTSPPKRLRRGSYHGSGVRGGPLSLHVFVPGIMSIGLLLSLVVLAVDGLRRVATGRTYERHVRLSADRIVAEAAAAAHGRRPEPVATGLRSRPTCAAVGTVFLGLAIYTVVGSTYNYFAMEWIRGVAWVWAVSGAAAVGFAWIGAASWVLVHRRASPPPFVWPLLRRTPLGDVRRRRQADRAG